MFSESSGKREDSGARESCCRFGKERREVRRPVCEGDGEISIGVCGRAID